jgi:hypothetical protein
MQLVTMHRPNVHGYTRPGLFGRDHETEGATGRSILPIRMDDVKQGVRVEKPTFHNESREPVSITSQWPMMHQAIGASAPTCCTGYNCAQRMALSSGTKLGPYEIQPPLGAAEGEKYIARGMRDSGVTSPSKCCPRRWQGKPIACGF